jgi:hypothetical protein
MRFISIIAVFIVLVISSGCTQRPSKPKPFLNEKQMVELLTELHLTEAGLQQMQAPKNHFDSVRLYTIAAYNKVFEKYGLNQETFEANLYYRTYYSRDLEKIFVTVHDILLQMGEEYQLEAIEEISEN